MTEIVAADIGGTNARFALAEIADDGTVTLGQPVTLRTGDYASLQRAWEAFGERLGRPLPRAAGLAVAGPIEGDELHLTNSSWIIQPASMGERLGLDRFRLVNDFGAVGHAVAACGADDFVHLAGPDVDIGAARVVSIVGPGTGLGVGLVVRTASGPEVIETEGGHIDFAPLDPLEDAVLHHLRPRYRRVSAERVASGPGLANWYEALAAVEGRAVRTVEDKALWTAAMDGSDSLAAAALDRFCLSLGAFAGDIALAQGAQALVVAGGLGLRLADRLPRSGFATRFVAKGRFEARMRALPVKLITHPQPGLLGAALAFARSQRDAVRGDPI